jgi:hypothetical protein
VAEPELLQQLLNYGLAGVVIYLLFRIVFNDLYTIKDELKAIKNEIRELRNELRRLLEK